MQFASFKQIIYWNAMTQQPYSTLLIIQIETTNRGYYNNTYTLTYKPSQLSSQSNRNSPMHYMVNYYYSVMHWELLLVFPRLHPALWTLHDVTIIFRHSLSTNSSTPCTTTTPATWRANTSPATETWWRAGMSWWSPTAGWGRWSTRPTTIPGELVHDPRHNMRRRRPRPGEGRFRPHDHSEWVGPGT